MSSNLYNNLEKFLLSLGYGAKHRLERIEHSIPAIIGLSIAISDEPLDFNRSKLLSSLIYSIFYMDHIVESLPDEIRHYSNIFDENHQGEHDAFVSNLRHSLLENPYFYPNSLYYNLMKDEFHTFLNAMLNESTITHENFSDYLEFSAQTTGASFALLGYFSAFSNIPDDFHSSHTQPLRAALHQLNRTLRLANDISGYEREANEAKVNAVSFWMNKHQLFAEESIRILWLTVQEELKHLLTLLTPLPLFYSQPILRSAEFVIKLYKNGDFHENHPHIPLNHALQRKEKIRQSNLLNTSLEKQRHISTAGPSSKVVYRG